MGLWFYSKIEADRYIESPFYPHTYAEGKGDGAFDKDQLHR